MLQYTVESVSGWFLNQSIHAFLVILFVCFSISLSVFLYLALGEKKRAARCSSSRLRRVRGRVRPLWVYSTQPFPAFLQEAVSRT